MSRYESTMSEPSLYLLPGTQIDRGRHDSRADGPDSELAIQIHQVLLTLLRFHPPSAASIDSQQNTDSDTAPSIAEHTSSSPKLIPQLLLGGGTTPAQDLAHFLTKSPNLLISTPGRLLELLSSPHVHCPQSSFEVLVMDEADRLLDLGFKNDLQRILQRLPKQRRTGLFSASVSEAVDQLVRVGLRNPVRIAVKVRGRDGKEDQRTPASLQMTYHTILPSHKLPTLLSLLMQTQPQPTRSIAYLSTCAAVDYFSRLLPDLLPLLPNTTAAQRPKVISLHGRQSPTLRQKQFTAFVTSTTPVLLLTTDVAARGLDIPQVDLTVQLDPPSDPKTFLHRAGRAGRAGRKGLAVVFLLPGRETEGYPPFLDVRKTPVQPLSAADSSIGPILDQAADPALAQSFSEKIRQLVLKDRALYDKAQRAFVSWVRSYSKHAASSIFRVSDLDWKAEAEGWGLLRLPKMPELKQRNGGEVVDRNLGLKVDWENFKYKDVQQEKKRKAEMAERASGVSDSRKPTGGQGAKQKLRKERAFSDKKDAQAVAQARREKKEKKRSAQKWEKMSSEEKAKERELREMVGTVRAKNASAAS